MTPFATSTGTLCGQVLNNGLHDPVMCEVHPESGFHLESVSDEVDAERTLALGALDGAAPCWPVGLGCPIMSRNL